MLGESAFRLTLSRFAVQGLKHVRWCVCQFGYSICETDMSVFLVEHKLI